MFWRIIWKSVGHIVDVRETNQAPLHNEIMSSTFGHNDDAVRQEVRELLNKVYSDYPNEIEEWLESGEYTSSIPISMNISSFEKFMEDNNYFPLCGDDDE